MANDTEDGRSLLLQNLRTLELSDEQIIQMLLMVLDDWEVRAEVEKHRRRRAPVAQQATIIQSGAKKVA